MKSCVRIAALVWCLMLPACTRPDQASADSVPPGEQASLVQGSEAAPADGGGDVVPANVSHSETLESPRASVNTPPASAAPCVGRPPSNTFPAPWTHYLGSTDRPAAWARSVRGIGRGVTASGDSARLVDAVSELLPCHDLVIPVGGINSGRNDNEVGQFMASVRANPKAWQDKVRQQTRWLLRLPRSGGIYWQVGNEINSAEFGKNVAGAMGRRAGRVSNDVLELYAEYYLAPTVVAIRRAQADLNRPATSVNIMLGTIGNGRSESSRRWLHSLLDYRIKGTAVPELKGRRVADLVDVAGLNYVLTTTRTERPAQALDDVWNWGLLRRVWATEEIGRKRGTRDLGSATAVLVWARYVDWWDAKRFTPAQGRAFLWGDRLGSDDAEGRVPMEDILAFLGPDAVLRPTTPTRRFSGGGALEIHDFQAETGGKRVAVLANVDSIAQSPGTVRVPASNLPRVAKAILYSREGRQEISASVGSNGVLQLGNLRSMPANASLLLVMN